MRQLSRAVVSLLLAYAAVALGAVGAAGRPFAGGAHFVVAKVPAIQIPSEQLRYQIACGVSVCFPAEPHMLKCRDGSGMGCKTIEGAYYAYQFTVRGVGDVPLYSPVCSKIDVVSESQLKAVSNAILNAQAGLIAQDVKKTVVEEEPIRVGVHYARRITYRTQADYGDEIVNAHTLIVAIASQSKICQFTFVPSATHASLTDTYAKAFFDTILPAVRAINIQ